MNVGLLNLGCVNNIVDSETVLGMLTRSGQQIVTDPALADVLIVNSCGLTSNHREESINNIVSLTGYAAKLVVIGCFSRAEVKELQDTIPAVDLWVTVEEYDTLHEQIMSLFPNENLKIAKFDPSNRLLSTPKYTAFLKINAGCEHQSQPDLLDQTRPLSEMMIEVKELTAAGVKEVMLVGTAPFYQSLLNREFKARQLLDNLNKIEELVAIRLPKFNPFKLADGVIDYVVEHPKVLPHFSFDLTEGELLNADKEVRIQYLNHLQNIVTEIRSKVDSSTIVAKIMIGDPREIDEEEFINRVAILKLLKFDNLIVSDEQVDFSSDIYPIFAERKEILKNAARKIAYRQNKCWVGKVIRGVVAHYDKQADNYELYSAWNSYLIKERITFKSDRFLREGQVVYVKINNAYTDGLHGEQISLC